MVTPDCAAVLMEECPALLYVEDSDAMEGCHGNAAAVLIDAERQHICVIHRCFPWYSRHRTESDVTSTSTMRSVLTPLRRLAGGVEWTASSTWNVLSKRGMESSPLSEPDLLPLEKEPYCRHRTELVLGEKVPVLAPDAFVAPSAVLIGDVDIYNKVLLCMT